MKKLFIAALIATGLISSSYASDANKVSYYAKNTFHSQFAGVSEVTWTVNDMYTKASFQWLGADTDAFFDASGNLIGTSKNATIEQLPLRTKRDLAKRLAGSAITQVIQFDANDKTSFFISAEGAKENVILKVSEGMISTFKKVKK